MNAYLNILQTLVPLYLIIILGYAAGAALRRHGATALRNRTQRSLRRRLPLRRPLQDG